MLCRVGEVKGYVVGEEEIYRIMESLGKFGFFKFDETLNSEFEFGFKFRFSY